MAFGGAAVVFTEHVLGNPTIGIAIHAFAGEAGFVGTILAVNALLRAHFRGDEKRERAANSMAQQVTVLMMVLGAELAGCIWKGDTPPLPAQWGGVSILIAATVAVMVAAAAAVLRAGPLLEAEGFDGA